MSPGTPLEEEQRERRQRRREEEIEGYMYIKERGNESKDFTHHSEHIHNIMYMHRSYVHTIDIYPLGY